MIWLPEAALAKVSLAAGDNPMGFSAESSGRGGFVGSNGSSGSSGLGITSSGGSDGSAGLSGLSGKTGISDWVPKIAQTLDSPFLNG